MNSAAASPSLGELVSTLSIASDLGMGRPVERVLRQTVIAMRLAETAGVAPEVRTATYYASLLTWVGCAADTSDLAVLFGEEADLFADTHDGDLTPLAMGMFVARHLGRGGPALRRVGMVGGFLVTAGRSVRKVMESHCQAAGDFAERLGLGDDVREAGQTSRPPAASAPPTAPKPVRPRGPWLPVLRRRGCRWSDLLGLGCQCFGDGAVAGGGQ